MTPSTSEEKREEEGRFQIEIESKEESKHKCCTFNDGGNIGLSQAALPGMLVNHSCIQRHPACTEPCFDM
jgi:hypothetical protein